MGDAADVNRANSTAELKPIRIGVSACLLGERVRFDGGHKRDSFLMDTLGRFVEFVPVCPEFELGLGVPRETLRLTRDTESVRLIANSSGVDHTHAMRSFALSRVAMLSREDLSGYVLKKDSPSCGMERVRVYGARGMPTRDGRGLFAAELMGKRPLLPVEEEGRLNDARLRENFIERVFAYHRLCRFFEARWTVGKLVVFHTAHKLQLMAHSPQAYAELGRMVADAGQRNRPEFSNDYQAGFMAALAQLATRVRNVNVLQHIAGYFRERIDAAGRAELSSMIQDYRAGLIPLVVPITLVRHYVRQFAIDYLQGQTYLEPHPKELMLRNHV
jgi:uncharacterized protein YbgA (DUF1722 family)/uncharacterized protein YbbK (DUF523 family)